MRPLLSCLGFHHIQGGQGCAFCRRHFPVVAYFGEIEFPVDGCNEDNMNIWEKDCIFCKGKGCDICDNSGKVKVFNWKGKTESVPYYERLFCFGIWHFIWWRFKKLIEFFKKWIIN
jgi:hypothetical protein